MAVSHNQMVSGSVLIGPFRWFTSSPTCSPKFCKLERPSLGAGRSKRKIRKEKGSKHLKISRAFLKIFLDQESSFISFVGSKSSKSTLKWNHSFSIMRKTRRVAANLSWRLVTTNQSAQSEEEVSMSNILADEIFQKLYWAYMVLPTFLLPSPIHLQRLSESCDTNLPMVPRIGPKIHGL